MRTGRGAAGPQSPGIVLEVRGRRATVLAQGRFLRLAAIPGWEAGEEVWVSPVEPRAWPALLWRWILGGGVALAAASTLGWTALAAAQTVALVSVDINPSIQFGVNAAGRIVSAVGADQSGARLVRSRHWRGETLPVAVTQVVSQAVREGYLTSKTTSGVVLIGVAPRSQAQLSATVQSQVAKARAQAESLLTKDGVQAAVPVVQTSRQTWHAAKKAGVSLGTYWVARTVTANESSQQASSLHGDSLPQALKQEGVPPADVGPIVQAAASHDRQALDTVLQQAKAGVSAQQLQAEVAQLVSVSGLGDHGKGARDLAIQHSGKNGAGNGSGVKQGKHKDKGAGSVGGQAGEAGKGPPGVAGGLTQTGVGGGTLAPGHVSISPSPRASHTAGGLGQGTAGKGADPHAKSEGKHKPKSGGAGQEKPAVGMRAAMVALERLFGHRVTAVKSVGQATYAAQDGGAKNRSHGG